MIAAIYARKSTDDSDRNAEARSTRRQIDSMRARWSGFSFWLAAVLVAGSAWGQVTPRIVHLDAMTCRELQALSGEQRDRLLIYLTGYLDGKQGATTWDERLTGQRIDRAMAACKSSPAASVLRVFTEAWSR
jgi:hypothetical protein